MGDLILFEEKKKKQQEEKEHIHQYCPYTCPSFALYCHSY